MLSLIVADSQVRPGWRLSYIGGGNDRRLVTAIELLGPANKRRDLYWRKQAELLDSKTHLVEIDLLRGGEHTTAVPEKRLRRFVPQFTYHVCSHRYDHFEDFLVYPIQFAEPLPTIQIPLSPGDGEVQVNLQQVFNRTYAAGPYHRERRKSYVSARLCGLPNMIVGLRIH